jgi:predicted small lipoprotein YifL
MKKLKLMKSVVVLFAVFALSSCEENGPIQFIVADDFTTTVSMNGLEGQTTYTTNSTTDISELLDGASKFVEADIESISIMLEDYSGTSLNGTVQIKAGTLTIVDQAVNLTSSATLINVPSDSGDILTLISSGNLPITVTGTATAPIEDNSFSIKATVNIRATVE